MFNFVNANDDDDDNDECKTFDLGIKWLLKEKLTQYFSGQSEEQKTQSMVFFNYFYFYKK